MIIVKYFNNFLEEISQTSQHYLILGDNILGKKIYELSLFGIPDFFIECVPEKIEFLNSFLINKIGSISTINILLIFPLDSNFDDIISSLHNTLKLVVNLYIFSNNDLNTWGGICYEGKKYIFDLNKYMFSDPPFMREAFSMVPYYSPGYLKELKNEPGYIVVKNKDTIGLEDYKSRYINHSNGKKVTVYEKSQYAHKIHVFGDSRAYAILTEDKYTFCSLLQGKLDKDALSYQVINYGIPGKDIERMVFQIKHADIKKGDLVFLTTGTPDFQGNIPLNIEVRMEYLTEIQELCNNLNVKFVYMNMPTLIEIKNPTELERSMQQEFQSIHFSDYNPKVIHEINELTKFRCMDLGIIYYDFTEKFQRPHDYGHLFLNFRHYGPNGNLLIADELYKAVQWLTATKNHLITEAKTLKESKDSDFLTKLEDIFVNRDLTAYIEDIKKFKVNKENIGAVLMNCNPFTKGHRFLIDYAASRVDHLYIFILQEENGDFSFADRFCLAKQNTLDLSNVTILPTGKVMGSKIFNSEYFKKSEFQTGVVDLSKDVILFASKIAPILNITKRFIGEEPNCNVTRQFNEQIIELSPKYNVEVECIPRKNTTNGKSVISASIVRTLLKEQKYDELKEHVTPITYEFLKKKYFADYIS
ncbi:hypothetical protein acsn021_37630 [Anaerocolumna cellulosilytica]|uniref:Uncharacterized protein n=1 Tax=Anaerocolumna cellulosilytica TaxID=433286 RepID=A0A6S6QZU9_9FIRM|nr:SGNH/GDSL hydrolase family protein [Anaerocolumna cellulosilytica]MBB5194971.1 hypothetical protein [Anaerocolumna cellulosilytica]BCJ96194.1 hypothetical protein acsn021_37630 [Anaerocolumna cellulosilytica]